VFPARGDVDKDQRTEWRVCRLRDEAEQTAHRGTDQNRRAGGRRLRSMPREQDQIANQLRKIVMAVGLPVAVAMAAAVGRQAMPAFAGQRPGGTVPGMTRLTEAVG